MLSYQVANLSEQPTLQNSFATQFSIPVTVIRNGNQGLFSGFVGRSPQASGGLIIAQLSNQLLFPRRLISIVCQDTSGTYAGRIDISTTGAISYILGNTTSYIGHGSFSFPYF